MNYIATAISVKIIAISLFDHVVQPYVIAWQHMCNLIILIISSIAFSCNNNSEYLPWICFSFLNVCWGRITIFSQTFFFHTCSVCPVCWVSCGYCDTSLIQWEAQLHREWRIYISFVSVWSLTGSESLHSQTLGILFYCVLVLYTTTLDC